eukprot:COSAG05_NODE_2746_length_2692_cov_5.948047_2_plen_219_part_01
MSASSDAGAQIGRGGRGGRGRQGIAAVRGVGGRGSSRARTPAPVLRSAPQVVPARVHIKLPGGETASVPADGLSTVLELKHRVFIAAVARGSELLSVERCRLVFAGRELDDTMSLTGRGSFMNESEIHLLLREISDVDLLQRQFRGKNKLSDYRVDEKVGGKDIGATPSLGGYSMNGVCSYVYKAQLRQGDGTQLALKVMINSGHANSIQIGREFEAER